MARDDERKARSNEAPIVGGLPEVPGIVVAMRLAAHLRGLADALLVDDFPGATLKTPPSAEAYRARAEAIAEHGYTDARVTSLPQ